MIQIVEFTISRTWFGLRIEISNFNPYFAIHQPFSMLWLKSLFFSPEFEYLTKSSVHVYVSFISCRFRAMINYCQIHINIRMLIIFRHMLQIISALLVYLRVLSTLSLSLWVTEFKNRIDLKFQGPMSALCKEEKHICAAFVICNQKACLYSFVNNLMISLAMNNRDRILKNQYYLHYDVTKPPKQWKSNGTWIGFVCGQRFEWNLIQHCKWVIAF